MELKPRPWDVLIVRDLDRIGRDTARTLLFVELLHDCGATVIEYSTGQEVRGDPSSRALVSMRGIFAEMERGMTSARTRGSQESRARRGLVTGGVVYGYKNRRRADGVVHEIHETEAEVVRDLYARAARGEGIRTIVHALNAAATPPPSAGRRGTGSWSPSVVHRILRNERYRGTMVWGRKRKGYKGGTKIRTQQGDETLAVVELPELRIVTEEVWQAVQARTQREKALRKEPSRTGRAPRYLLTGLARCSQCGGPIGALRGKRGAEVIQVYGCAWHRSRGDTVCSNTLRRPVDIADAAVLGWIEEHVLSPAVLANVVATVRQQLHAAEKQAPGERAAEVERIKASVAALDREIGNLTAALASGASGGRRCGAGTSGAGRTSSRPEVGARPSWTTSGRGSVVAPDRRRDRATRDGPAGPALKRP